MSTIRWSLFSEKERSPQKKFPNSSPPSLMSPSENANRPKTLVKNKKKTSIPTAIAETEVSLIEVLRTTFLRVIAEYPESAAKLRALIALRLRKTVDSLEAARADYDALAPFSTGARDGVSRARKEG